MSLMFRCTTSVTDDCWNYYNGYYFCVVIGNNFYNDYYNLNVNFVNCFVICFDNYRLICYNLICYMSYFLIDCSGNSDFDYWSSFYFYYMMSFVIDCLDSIYSLIGN